MACGARLTDCHRGRGESRAGVRVSRPASRFLPSRQLFLHINVARFPAIEVLPEPFETNEGKFPDQT
jgi:hypothetical protein